MTKNVYFFDFGDRFDFILSPVSLRMRSDRMRWTGPDRLVRADQLFGPWIPGLTFENNNDVECIVIFSRSNFPFATRTFHWLRCSCSRVCSRWYQNWIRDPCTAHINRFNQCLYASNRLCYHFKKQWFESKINSYLTTKVTPKPGYAKKIYTKAVEITPCKFRVSNSVW